MARKKRHARSAGTAAEQAGGGRAAGGRRDSARARGGGRGPTRAEAAIHCPAGHVVVWGRHAAEAVLANPARRIKAMYLAEDAAEWFGGLAPATPLPEPVPVDKARLGEGLESLSAGREKAVHQGVALVAEKLEPPTLGGFLEGDMGERPVLVLLDQVADGRNIGAIMRSARAFGAAALVATERNCPPESALMLRAASGAAEHVPLLRIVNLARAMEMLKDHGFVLAAMTADGDASIERLAGEDRLGIVMGAEGRGLRRLTLERADLRVRIPIVEAAESLNVSAAAAVALFAARGVRKD